MFFGNFQFVELDVKKISLEAGKFFRESCLRAKKHVFMIDIQLFN